jgi:hypothetical protein
MIFGAIRKHLGGRAGAIDPPTDLNIHEKLN